MTMGKGGLTSTPACIDELNLLPGGNSWRHNGLPGYNTNTPSTMPLLGGQLCAAELHWCLIVGAGLYGQRRWSCTRGKPTTSVSESLQSDRTLQRNILGHLPRSSPTLCPEWNQITVFIFMTIGITQSVRKFEVLRTWWLPQFSQKYANGLLL